MSAAEYRPIDSNYTDPFTVGLKGKEARQYSILRAVQSVVTNGKVEGFEKEVHDTIRARLRSSGGRTDQTRALNNEAGRILIPSEVTRYTPNYIRRKERALNAQTATAGGTLVATNVSSTMIELLRNNMVVESLGTTILSDLVGDVSISRQSGAQTAYWLSAGATVSQSQPTFGAVQLQPRRLAASVPYDKQLLMQTGYEVESLVRQDAMQVVAHAIDLATLYGIGPTQPTGIVNTPNVPTTTFGGPATWASVLNFETLLATANALGGDPAYLISPATRGKWKGAPKVGSYPAYLMETDGTVNGYHCGVTTQIPDNKVFFGNWRDLIIAMWSGIEMIVDPFTLKRSGQIELTTQVYADVALKHAASFLYSTDSGAQ